MAQAASKSCEICDGGPGCHYCQQCDQFFCVNCKTSHLRTKISKNHTFFSGLSINQEEKPFCSEHDEPFIFHCIDCDTAVCQICAVKKHNRHNMLGMEESVQTLKGQVQKCVEFQVEHLRNNITEVEQGTTKYQSEIEAAAQSIAEDAERLKDLIDQRAKDLMKSLKETGKTNLELLSTANCGFNNTLERFNVIQRAIVDTANMLDVAVLPKVKQFKKETNNIEIKDVPGLPEIEYAKKSISETDIRNLFGEMTFR